MRHHRTRCPTRSRCRRGGPRENVAGGPQPAGRETPPSPGTSRRSRGRWWPRNRRAVYAADCNRSRRDRRSATSRRSFSASPAARPAALRVRRKSGWRRQESTRAESWRPRLRSPPASRFPRLPAGRSCRRPPRSSGRSPDSDSPADRWHRGSGFSRWSFCHERIQAEVRCHARRNSTRAPWVL